MGGADGEPEKEESVLIQVYCARIAHKIYEVYWQKGRMFTFVMLFMSFSDRDIQKLLLVEDATAKSARMGAVRDAIKQQMSPRSQKRFDESPRRKSGSPADARRGSTRKLNFAMPK